MNLVPVNLKCSEIGEDKDGAPGLCKLTAEYLIEGNSFCEVHALLERTKERHSIRGEDE